jgi:Domain of unknown function (DUF5659)
MQTEQMTENRTFEISDFACAVYLRCTGYQIVEIRGAGTRKHFVFEDAPTRQQDVAAYYADRAKVNPSEYSRTIRDLKGMLNNSR